MSFKQKTWKDRISEHPNRRTLTDVSDNTTKTVDVAREEGTISQEGDAFSATNMNDLEGRIADGFSTLSQDSLKMSSSNPSSDSIKFGINASGQYGYIKQGASEVTPFRNPTGNANPSDVLSGKTFSTASLENARGTMPNHGGYTASESWARNNGKTYIRIPKGAYLTAANNGLDLPEVTVADNLYGQEEYNNNYSSGYNSGYANGRKSPTVTAKGSAYVDNYTSTDFYLANGIIVTIGLNGDNLVTQQILWKHGATISVLTTIKSDSANFVNLTVDSGNTSHVSAYGRYMTMYIYEFS